MGQSDTNRTRRARGFRRAASLVQAPVRKAGETRGFAVARLLTHWDEIVGPDIAAFARPVNVGYGRSFGATLTLLTNGASAQLVQMQLPRIIERVNACYGYAAIAKIRVTQSSATGFDEAAPAGRRERTPPPETVAKAAETAAGVADAELRAALQALGQNVLSRGT